MTETTLRAKIRQIKPAKLRELTFHLAQDRLDQAVLNTHRRKTYQSHKRLVGMLTQLLGSLK